MKIDSHRFPIVSQPRHEILGRQICADTWPRYAAIPPPIAWALMPEVGVETGVLDGTQIERGCHEELENN